MYNKLKLKDYKVIAFDVDETVISNCEPISIEMASLINKLKDKIVLFISGTDVIEICKLVSRRLSIPHHIVGSTGSHYSYYDEEEEIVTINEFLLSDDQENQIFLALNRLVWEYDLKPLTKIRDQILHRKTQITLSALGRHAPKDKKASFDPDKKKRKKYVKFLRRYLLEKDFNIRIGGTTSVDITLSGIDKAFGMEKFMKYTKVRKGDILYFGDKFDIDGNDYPIKMMGVKCVEVKSPKDTYEILNKLVV